jgi:tripartite-type tricarboxylate transporter receptor subunit TctC
VFEQVGRQVGQTFVIENRPGAGGTTGANAVAKAAPDGTTILAYGAMAGSAALYAKLPYDPLDDFIR